MYLLSHAENCVPSRCRVGFLFTVSCICQINYGRYILRLHTHNVTMHGWLAGDGSATLLLVLRKLNATMSECIRVLTGFSAVRSFVFPVVDSIYLNFKCYSVDATATHWLLKLAL